MVGKPFDGLKTAIIELLENATLGGNDGITRLEAPLICFQNLQAEYNIHFVEPEDKQVDIV